MVGGGIVVALSERPEGRAAVDRAIDEARLRDLPVVLVAGDGVETALFRARFEASGLRHEVVATGGDHPAEALLDLVTERGADLLVVGVKRRSPTGKLILGTGVQKILLDAPCPVLAVKETHGAG